MKPPASASSTNRTHRRQPLLGCKIDGELADLVIEMISRLFAGCERWSAT